jgi:hypothetical protein
MCLKRCGWQRHALPCPRLPLRACGYASTCCAIGALDAPGAHAGSRGTVHAIDTSRGSAAASLNDEPVHGTLSSGTPPSDAWVRCRARPFQVKQPPKRPPVRLGRRSPRSSLAGGGSH